MSKKADKYRAQLNAAMTKAIDYLESRWQDEHEYEDWNEYIQFLKDKIPDGFTFIKATKKPFGCHTSRDGIDFHHVVKGNQITITSEE